MVNGRLAQALLRDIYLHFELAFQNFLEGSTGRQLVGRREELGRDE